MVRGEDFTISRNMNRLAVDIGGTFTDVVVEWPGGRVTTKILTTPDAPENGVFAGISVAMKEAGLVAGDIDILVHGTTLATNAIIERKGAVTALITTAGFRDTIDIGYESRYDQYDIYLDKPEPLVPRRLRLTVPERLNAQGKILIPLDEDAVKALVPQLEQLGVKSVAVGFLHSYANPAHEERVRDLLIDADPDLYVTNSSEVCPEIREYERLSTACANAYIQPVMSGYLSNLRDELARRGYTCPIFMMTSGGGLMTLDAAIRLPIRLMESGPAGGAILASHIAAECQLEKVVSFDMGGTTAKICLIENYEPQTARSFEVDRAARFLKGSGLPLRIPVIEMLEIGAGGGSIARADEMQQIAVGPDSAGADPGPACYQIGGEEATVTDADVLLGRIDIERFAGGKVDLEPERASKAINQAIAEPLNLTTSLAAYGIAEIVDERMANAARVHAIERGKVIGDHALIAFGGAAPLHATRLAEKLGIDRIVVPTNAGVGSAVGFLRAPVAYEVVHSHYMRLKDFDPTTVNTVLRGLNDDARSVVRAGAPDEPLVERRTAFMRYVGQGHEIVVPLPDRDLVTADADVLQNAFDEEYKQFFARVIPHADVEILSWIVSVSTKVERPLEFSGISGGKTAMPDSHRPMYDAVHDDMVDVPVFLRSNLAQGAIIPGPSVITEDETATYVSAAFDAHINAGGYIILERRRDVEGTRT
jgi:N-methylhydantoinase A